MDPNYVINGVMTLIHHTYPEGMDGFEKDGGVFTLIPGEANEVGCVLYYLPGETPESLQKVIDENNSRNPFKILKVNSLNTELEYEGVNKVASYIGGLLKCNVIVTDLERIALYIFVEVSLQDETLSEINRFMNKNFPGVVRGVIVHGAGTHYLIAPVSESFTAPASATEERGVIMPDDIMNLRILLGKCSDVDSFINSI